MRTEVYLNVSGALHQVNEGRQDWPQFIAKLKYSVECFGHIWLADLTCAPCEPNTGELISVGDVNSLA
jgi:glycine cleavage system H lipoate-binding protein